MLKEEILDEIYEDDYKGYCLKTKLAPNTWLIKLLGEFLKYDGVSVILEIKNEIKNAELSNLKKLYLTKKKIESADIENSKNLEELHLFSNDILSFEIKNLKRLFIHKIDDLIIRPGTFDKCINLTEISFYDVGNIPKLNPLSLEKLEKVLFERCVCEPLEDFSAFQSLKSLSLINCKIEKIEKLSNQNLEVLNLSDNRISYFDHKIVLECKKLKEIILKENIITDVNFSNIICNFDFIDLSKNRLKIVPLIENVKKLDVSFNELICFSLPNFDTIEEIIFDNNIILTKPETVKSKSLKKLSIKVDKLCADINDLLPDEACSLTSYKLSNMDTIKAVFKRYCDPACTTNKIFELKKDKDYPKQIFYNNASNLKKRNELIIEHDIKEFSNSTRKGKYDILNEDEISTEKCDYKCSYCAASIELLNKNAISLNREFDRFKTTLTELHLENVKFETNQFPNLSLLECLKELKILNCLTIINKSLIIDEKNLPKKIKHLELIRNKIMNIKKISLNECAEINLSENGIETIDLIECKYTKKINLSNNLLKSLINLKNFKYLQEINLDYNEISEINDLAFDQLLKLKVISLKYNKLSKMFATKSKSIQEIHINGNNINEIGNEMANIVKK